MITATRKLIDLEPSVVSSINRKARLRNMSFKRYVEELISADARAAESDNAYAGIQSRELLSLVGIAKETKKKEESDEKLDYILSKL